MALQFVSGSADKVNLGRPVLLQDIRAGTMLVWANPSAWPAAGLRAIVYINGTSTGFRNFSTAGLGGTLGLRLLVDRATTALNVGALPGDVPFAGANKPNCWVVTWNVDGVDADQHLYGGDQNAPLTEVTTYQSQIVGSGTVSASTNAADTVIGGNSTNQGFPGVIYDVAIWDRVVPLVDLQWMRFALSLSAPLGWWTLGADGPAAVWDYTGRTPGTISGALVVPGTTPVGYTRPRRRWLDVPAAPAPTGWGLLLGGARNRLVSGV